MKIMIRLDKMKQRAIREQNFTLATKIRSEMRARCFWSLSTLLRGQQGLDACENMRIEKAAEALDLMAIRNAGKAGTTHEGLFGDGDNTYGVDLGDLKHLYRFSAIGGGPDEE